MAVDRIGFAPARAVTPEELEGVQTMADAERLLQRKGIPFNRRSAIIDPADLPSDLVPKLVQQKLGEVFYGGDGATGMFGAVLERSVAPVPVAEQLDRARTILKRRKQEQALEQALVGLRQRAKVSYQKGYGPSAGKSAEGAETVQK
jgi:hypothetical protein